MRYLATLFLVVAVPALAADTGIGVGLWGGYATIQMKELNRLKPDMISFIDEVGNMKGYTMEGGEPGYGYLGGIEVSVRTWGGLATTGDEVRTVFRAGYIGMEGYNLTMRYRGVNPWDSSENIEYSQVIDGWAYAFPLMTGWRYTVPATEKLRVGGDLLLGAVIGYLESDQTGTTKRYDLGWNLKSEESKSFSPRFRGTGFGMQASAAAEYRLMEKLWAGLEVGYRYMPVMPRSTRDVDTNNDGDTTDWMTDDPSPPHDSQDINKGDVPQNAQKQDWGIDFNGLTVAVKVTQEF